jgi:hypothetical protein
MTCGRIVSAEFTIEHCYLEIGVLEHFHSTVTVAMARTSVGLGGELPLNPYVTLTTAVILLVSPAQGEMFVPLFQKSFLVN